MNKHLKELIEISRFYGSDKEFVIAGGGNTSYKDEQKLWIKASGTSMAGISENEFAVLDLKKLWKLSNKTYSTGPVEREKEVKDDLLNCLIDQESGLRPSVETSLHAVIRYKYVVHTHPTFVNALMCSKNGLMIAREMFGEMALYIPYVDPGYSLFKVVEKEINDYRDRFGSDPKIVFLKNHGVIVGSDNTDEIKRIYNDIITRIREKIRKDPPVSSVDIPEVIAEILPAIRMMLYREFTPVVSVQNNALIRFFLDGSENYKKISQPLTPDMVVYCGKEYIVLHNSGSAKDLLSEFKGQLNEFQKRNGHQPKVIFIKDIGMVVAAENMYSVETIMNVMKDRMKISFYSLAFGGPESLTTQQVNFIDSWEAEHYRRKVAEGDHSALRMENKIAVVTGGARGFGRGIAEGLFHNGANVVIADVDCEKGRLLEDKLNENNPKNRALFIETDVTGEESVRDMIFQTVSHFGGLDVLISNAGVLRAGSLEEMDTGTFDYVTRVNYNAFFICAKVASEVLKRQYAWKPDYFADIIQVNSKSGLKGSNKNFAYAGSKFGGIGLTQSFALELIEFNVKVNAVCPGNFFDGPLWSDPESGLFVQYLKAGKVPGAKSLDDIREYYENQVPMKRGCLVEDVLKAIYYIVEQKYETGQAYPVTGGQIMLA